MRSLLLENGGRPFANDDIHLVQAEAQDAAEAALQGAGAMVLSGCQVSRAPGAATGDIASGYIWLAGQICRYLGASAVPFPAEVVAGSYEVSDYRPYQTGGSKACQGELVLLTQAAGTAPAGTERVVFERRATRTYCKWLESQQRQLGDLMESVGPPAADIDTTPGSGYGLGLLDGPRAGWALANGNNGTADLRGLFRVALSDAAGDYDTPGKKGGAESVRLTAAQNGPHTHDHSGYSQNIQYDRGSTGGSPEGNKTTTKQTSQSGEGQPHENRPPYYVTVVWQWVGL
jgi:hypothetical protein